MPAMIENAQVSSDHRKWKKVFGTLVQMLQTQQTQLETLLEERKRLEDRIKIQYDRWASDIRLFDDQISQLKREVALAEITRLVETAKFDLVAGLKNREAFVNKLKLEHAEDELTDFKAWFDFLSHRCSDQKACIILQDMPPHELYEILKGEVGREDGTSKKRKSKKAECLYQTLENEVKRLKREYEKLSVKSSSEVSALQSEKKFVWNQYRTMESDYNNQLKKKNDELNQLNDRISKLLANLEGLQSANKEKDSKIASMEANVALLDSEAKKKNEDISRLSKEVEVLRGLKSAPSVTPVLRRCTAEPKASTSEGKNGTQNRRTTGLKTESASLKVYLDQENRTAKRKATADIVPKTETPKLFSSSFKIPKLKNSSPR
ncbi:hypothetical protein Ancab_016738 [Ancistrocladus abbreviatus]